MASQQSAPISPPSTAPSSPPPYSTAATIPPTAAKLPTGQPLSISPGQPVSPGSISVVSSPGVPSVNQLHHHVPASVQAPPFNHSISMPNIPQYAPFQPGSPPTSPAPSMNPQYNPGMMVTIMTPNGPVQVSREQIQHQLNTNAIQSRPVQLPNGTIGYELAQAASAPPAVNVQPIPDAAPAQRPTFSHRGTRQKLYHPLTTAKEVMQHGTVRKTGKIVGIVSSETVALFTGVNVLKDAAVISNAKIAREKNKQAKQQAAQQASQQSQSQSQPQPQQHQQPQLLLQPQQYQAQLGSPNTQTLQYTQSAQVHMLQGLPNQQLQPQMQPMYHPIQHPQALQLHPGAMVPSAFGQVPTHAYAGHPLGLPAALPGNIGQYHAPNMMMNQAQPLAPNGVPFVNAASSMSPQYGAGQSQVHLQSSRILHNALPVNYAMAFPHGHPPAMLAHPTGVINPLQNANTASGLQIPTLNGVHPQVHPLQGPQSPAKVQKLPEGSIPAQQSQPVTVQTTPNNTSQAKTPETPLQRSPTSPHQVPRKPVPSSPPTAQSSVASPSTESGPDEPKKSEPNVAGIPPTQNDAPQPIAGVATQAATQAAPTYIYSRPDMIPKPLAPQNGLPSISNLPSNLASMPSMVPSAMPRQPFSMNSISSSALGISSVLGIGSQLESLNLMHHQDEMLKAEIAPSTSQADPNAQAAAASMQDPTASSASAATGGASFDAAQASSQGDWSSAAASQAQASAGQAQDPSQSASSFDASQASSQGDYSSAAASQAQASAGQIQDPSQSVSSFDASQASSQCDWSSAQASAGQAQDPTQSASSFDASQASSQGDWSSAAASQAQASAGQIQDPTQSASSFDASQSSSQAFWSSAAASQDSASAVQAQDPSQSFANSTVDPTSTYQYTYIDPTQQQFVYYQSDTSYQDPSTAGSYTYVDPGQSFYAPDTSSWVNQSGYASYDAAAQTPVQDASAPWDPSSTTGTSYDASQYDYGSQDASSQDQTAGADPSSSLMAMDMNYGELDACASLNPT